MMLNYDMTFLALLLTGLYEPETDTGRHRCLPHPVHRHPMVCNAAVDYAADMCVLLAWQKLRDDWEDERKYTGRAAAAALRPAYQRAARTWPRQAEAIERNIRRLRLAERRGLHDIDMVAGLTGHFLAEIFAWKEDAWAQDLRTMGFYLGKFIYLMDALEDIRKDAGHGSYNLFAQSAPVWGTPKEEEIRAALTDMTAQAARAFERLPVLQNAEILRNILYSGVWCRYAAMREREKRISEKAKPSGKRAAEDNRES